LNQSVNISKKIKPVFPFVDVSMQNVKKVCHICKRPLETVMVDNKLFCKFCFARVK